MIKPEIIYFDLDGVLANFEQGVKNLEIDFDDVEALNPDQKHIVFNTEGFFLDLEILPGSVEMVNFARENFKEVHILTATGYSNFERIRDEKITWSNRYFPGLHCAVVKKSHEKAIYAWPGNDSIVLIDDRYEKSIVPFIEAGGIGIHHTSPENTIVELKKLL
jgi:5'(3')-deoxyribonucleotidase